MKIWQPLQHVCQCRYRKYIWLIFPSFLEILPYASSHKQQVDELFLAQINQWRISLSNALYNKHKNYRSIQVLNDVVQEFINQIVFLRICEENNLPTYHRLSETIKDPAQLFDKFKEILLMV